MRIGNMGIMGIACLMSSIVTVTITKGGGVTSVASNVTRSVARPVARAEAGGVTRSVAITVVVATGSTLAVARAMAMARSVASGLMSAVASGLMSTVARAPRSISLSSHDCCKSRDCELHVLYQEDDFLISIH